MEGDAPNSMSCRPPFPLRGLPGEREDMVVGLIVLPIDIFAREEEMVGCNGGMRIVDIIRGKLWLLLLFATEMIEKNELGLRSKMERYPKMFLGNPKF